MKATTWKAIASRSLNPRDWEFQGNLAYKGPTNLVLSGYLAEGSGFDKGVYLWRVRAPLLIPSTSLVLTYSERLDHEKFYDDDSSRLSRVLDGSISPAKQESDFFQEMSNTNIDTPNRRRLEIRAYSKLLLGEDAQAMDSLRRIHRFPIESPWHEEVAQRCASVEAEFLSGGRAAVMPLFDTWASETASALRVTRRN